MATPTTIYIFEIKVKGSAKSALDQITLNNYDARYALSGKPVVKIGMRFDRRSRTIRNWVITQ